MTEKKRQDGNIFTDNVEIDLRPEITPEWVLIAKREMQTQQPDIFPVEEITETPTPETPEAINYIELVQTTGALVVYNRESEAGLSRQAA